MKNTPSILFWRGRSIQHFHAPQIRKALAALLNESIASAVEKELFQRWETESKRYTSQGRELIVNLRDPSNPDLKERILTGTITPEELSVATSEVRGGCNGSERRSGQHETFLFLPYQDLASQVLKDARNSEAEEALKQSIREDTLQGERKS